MLDSKEQYELVTLLLKISNSINRRRNLKLRKLNLTSRQVDVLRYVSNHANSTMTTLAIVMGCAHQTIQEVLLKMKQKHLIKMVKSPKDGRCRVIVMTKLGQKRAKYLGNHPVNSGEQLVRDMSNENQKLLLMLLTQSLNNLDN